MRLPECSIPCSAAGMLAPDGRCKTLDAAADGYVRAEAVVCHILRSQNALEAQIQDEVRAGDRAPGVGSVLVLGTAVNQDGRSSSLTAPNGPSQSSLIASALLLCSRAARKVGKTQRNTHCTSSIRS